MMTLANIRFGSVRHIVRIGFPPHRPYKLLPSIIYAQIYYGGEA